MPREATLAQFNAFASPEKTLHANSGWHINVPLFELDSSDQFFARRLVWSSSPPRRTTDSC